MFHSEFYSNKFFLSFLIIFNWKFRIDSSILNRKFYRIFFFQRRIFYLLYIVFCCYLNILKIKKKKKRKSKERKKLGSVRNDRWLIFEETSTKPWRRFGPVEIEISQLAVCLSCFLFRCTRSSVR